MHNVLLDLLGISDCFNHLLQERFLEFNFRKYMVQAEYFIR
jgi:hypothetical protein